MLSLASLVLEEGQRPDTFGDDFPLFAAPPIFIAPPPPSVTALDRVSQALRSSFRPLILWGLSEYPRICDREKHAFKIIPSVVSLLANPHRAIEYAAITCIGRLLKTNPRSISGSLLNSVLDHLDQFPFSEYVSVLCDILPCCTSATFESIIIPLVHRFIGRSTAYDCVVGELLTSHQFAIIPPSPDLFARFLTSTVLINDYLPALIQLAVATGGVTEDWCCRLYPSLIVHAGRGNPAARPGAVEALAYLSDVIHPSHMFGYLVMAFDWCAENREVGLALAARADEVLTSRTVVLAPRFAALIRDLCGCGDASVLARVPRILGNNPGVFLSGDQDVAELIDALAACPGVRAAFLDSYVLLFARTPGHAAQEALLRAFRQLFDSLTPAIVARLAAAQTYAFFGPAKLLQIIPALVAFAPGLRAWRNVAQLAQTFLSFPAEVLRPFWHAIAGAMLPLFIRNVHPLAVQCLSFCARFAALLEHETRLVFLDGAVRELGAGGWAARRLIAPLAGSVVTMFPPADAKFLHAAVRARLADPVRAVVAGVLGTLAKLRQLWELKGEEELERDVVEMFEALRNTTDELLLAAWHDAWEASASRGGLSSLPKLPQSVMRSELTKKTGVVPLKAVASLQSAVRKPPGLLGLGAGKPRRRTFQVADMHGDSVGAASYSGPGLAGPRLTEPGLSMIGGPLAVGPGMGGARRVERTTRGGRG